MDVAPPLWEAGATSRQLWRSPDLMHLLAYIDPGSGSLFIQAVIATVLVVPFFLRSQIRKGVDRLRGHHPVATSTAIAAQVPPAAVKPTDDAVPPAGH
jgi:hypothetical protein